MHAGPRHGPYRRRLRADPNFFLELQFCNDNGLPHSEFLEWSPEDRGKALAFRYEMGDRCQMCGTADWEWDTKQGGRRFAYEPVAHTCKGCQAKEIAQEGNEKQPGVTIVLRPTGTIEWAKSMVARKRRERRRSRGRG